MTVSDLDKLVALRTKLDSHQAQLLKTNLEGRGVPAFVANENVSSLISVNTADLYVRAKDWRTAEELLTKIEASPRHWPQPPPEPEVVEQACSHCGSHRVVPYVDPVPTWVPFVSEDARPEDGWLRCLECGSHTLGRRRRFAGLGVAFGWSAFMALLAFSVILLINWLRYL